jgi:uncharacterized protein YcbX
MHVSELYLYPIKSARGIALERAELDERGFRHDRRWMLVDADGRFISQRVAHRMALIDVALADGALLVSAPGMAALRVPCTAQGAPERCTIWRDVVAAHPVSGAVDEWFSTFLSLSCRLMYMPDETRRIVDRAYVQQERVVGFADAFPLLLIGQASLDLLNHKLVAQGENAVPMRRFRPNIVIAEARAHEEDEWRQIRIGEIGVDVVKSCARCVITTVDIDSAEAGREPLRTLAGYRKQGSKVMFGQNAVHRQLGSVSIGDAITVLSRRDQ